MAGGNFGPVPSGLNYSAVLNDPAYLAKKKAEAEAAAQAYYGPLMAPQTQTDVFGQKGTYIPSVSMHPLEKMARQLMGPKLPEGRTMESYDPQYGSYNPATASPEERAAVDRLNNIGGAFDAFQKVLGAVAGSAVRGSQSTNAMEAAGLKNRTLNPLPGNFDSGPTLGQYPGRNLVNPGEPPIRRMDQNVGMYDPITGRYGTQVPNQGLRGLGGPSRPQVPRSALTPNYAAPEQFGEHYAQTMTPAQKAEIQNQNDLYRHISTLRHANNLTSPSQSYGPESEFSSHTNPERPPSEYTAGLSKLRRSEETQSHPNSDVSKFLQSISGKATGYRPPQQAKAPPSSWADLWRAAGSVPDTQ